MRLMPPKEYELFKTIVGLSQDSLKKSLANILQNKYKDVIVHDKFLYASGDIPVLLVAHMDTVFTRLPANIYYDKDQNVIWSPEGLGADDRAGVFSIIKILKTGMRPSVLFTCDEEMGAIGACKFIEVYPDPIDDLKYVIQLDRRGSNDAVFYDCDNPDFCSYVESFGFSEAIGSFSDISEICPQWKIAGVNLSVGYENEHSISEVLHVNHMYATIDKVIKMLKVVNKTSKFVFIPSELMKRYFPYKDIRWEDWTATDTITCKKCHLHFDEYEVIPVKTKENKTVFYCPDCVIENVEWCLNCGEAFEIDPKNISEHLCPECRARIGGKQDKCSKKSKINLVK